MDFTGKIVIITGASSGIGAATAKYLTGLGATCVLAARSEANLKAIHKGCVALGKVEPFLVVTDVTRREDCEKLFRLTIAKYGRVDVLVNNAGKGAAGSIEVADLEQFDDILNTNLRSVFTLTKLAVPHLIESRGNIVNVSSVAGTNSFPNALSYCVSKAALDQFTRCTALDLAQKGVRVNSVNPAVIVTEFHKVLGMDEKSYAAYLKHSESTHPMGRVGNADEVAAAIAFLACDKTASFTTGTCLCVDGGKHIMTPR
ncbi:3-oxoacyl-[acyl-carrier-protein] reductase FabG-like [Anopheles aquasalis]|uniref:3-oxoacyl-[acyl-carrier-protein] reductase FabG-like n=1 Tax=Anopheles aquasalis TaxID=42839 RepID=UPI00215AE7D4|nr:3-oxoacyl-[acyl-carrier-protein] reductase FabG-like [Anopheles aquasalis]